jgi:hypothetical protein
MNSPSDTIHGSVTFHAVSEKLADGTFRAYAPAMPHLGEAKASGEMDAHKAFREKVEAYVASGDRAKR